MKNGLIKWDHKEIPDEEIKGRIQTVQSRMKKENLDALILFGDVNESGAVNYFSNFAPYYFSTALILAQNGEGLMTSAMAQRGKPWIQSNSLTKDIRFNRDYGKGCADVLEGIDLKHNRVGMVELDLFPYPAFQKLKETFPQIEFIDFTDKVNELRIKRTPVELKLIHKASEAGVDTIESVVRNWNFNRECELAAEIERQARYRACEDIFVHITSHTEGAHWLHLPTEKNLQGEVMVEMMVQYKNYWAILGRTILPEKAEPSLARLKKQAEQLYFSVVNRLKPGTTVNDVFDKIINHVKSHLEVDAITLIEKFGEENVNELINRGELSEERGKIKLLE